MATGLNKQYLILLWNGLEHPNGAAATVYDPPVLKHRGST